MSALGFTIAAVVVWAVCGGFAYGGTFAYFQRRYPRIADDQRDEDHRFAAVMALLGPAGLITCILYHGFRYGLRFR